MITIGNGKQYSGWQEDFIRACYAMMREGSRSREFLPYGRIREGGDVRCPDCHSELFFTGTDLICSSVFEGADARFCVKCGKFETKIHFYKSKDPRKVLQMLKLNPHLAVDEGTPCPSCGSSTCTLREDMGGVDYHDNSWTVCKNRFCDWPGSHKEDYQSWPGKG
jgi:hypothetical protein